MTQSMRHIILLTDGRTYGDESRCVQIARWAQERGIGLTALGVGDEWNEDLLETMTAKENSRTQYITSIKDITNVFAEELKRMHSIFARKVQLLIDLRPQSTLRSLDRVQPFISPVHMVEEENLRWVAELGDWPSTDTQAFLLEIIVPPLDTGDHSLLRLTLTYNLPRLDEGAEKRQLVLRVTVRPPEEVSPAVDSTVKHWLERLIAYRLQSRAWQNVETGCIDEAAQQLRMAGTRLLEVGEVELARTVEDEAVRLLRSGTTTAEGRKRIKYGTRGLMTESLR